MVVGWNGAVLLSGRPRNNWKAARITGKALHAGRFGDDGFAIVVGGDGVMLTDPRAGRGPSVPAASARPEWRDPLGKLTSAV